MREGFEVLFAHTGDGDYRFEGRTAAVEAGEAWSVEYVIVVDSTWVTRRAEVAELTSSGARWLILDHDGRGRWRVDGVSAPGLNGCLDVDLEASAFTNALPVHRLGLGVGEGAQVAAACAAAPGLDVAVLAQRYERLPDQDGNRRFSYSAPRHDFAAELRYDESGLVADYPKLAMRVL